MKLDKSIIQRSMEWGFDQATKGLPTTPSAIELAQDYLKKNNNDVQKATASLIRWQTGKAAAVGFATGLPGIMALPVTLPADLLSTLYLQIRMVAAIAIMGGYELRSDQVKTLVFGCLVGDSAVSLVKKAGIEFGKEIAKKQLDAIGKEAIKKTNETVAKNIMAKYGTKGAASTSKLVPLIGGLIGAAFDSAETYAIGKAAKKLFLDTQSPVQELRA